MPTLVLLGVLLALGTSWARPAAAQPLHTLPPAQAQPPTGRGPTLPQLDEPLDAAFAAPELAAIDETAEAPAGGLLGTWGHGRDGVSLQYSYVGEVFNNMRGGIRTAGATQYRGDADIMLQVDLDHYELLPGGKIYVLGENGHGRGLTLDYVGDYQVLSNIDAPDFTQITDYWWERRVFENRVGLRLGKQDCNSEFAVVELALDFVNSSFGLQPTIPMPTWPYGSAAAALHWDVTDKLMLKAGVWDGAPTPGSWGFSGSGVAFSILEAKRRWQLDDGRLPGVLHVGTWYQNDAWEAVQPIDDSTAAMAAPLALRYGKLGSTAAGANTPTEFAGNYGFYGGWEQWIWNETGEAGDNPQGWGAFLQYAWAPEDRNFAFAYLGAGILDRGRLPGRDDDVMGLGMARVYFSPAAELQNNETAVELFYKYQVNDDLFLEPDLQYIARPSGRYRDAFVFGVRMGANL